MKFGLVGFNEHSLPFVNTPFSPKSPLSEGPLCHLIWIFVYNLAILAFNRHFCHFCQNRHFPKGHFANSFEFLFTVWRFWRLPPFLPFLPKRHSRQNCHSPKGPFAISFEFLFTVWRFWRLIAISAVFANACISGHISLQGFGQSFERTNFYLCNPFIQTTNLSTLFCSKTCAYPPVLAGSV